MRPALAVFESYLSVYRRTWRGSVLGSFVLPVLVMVGFGLGVGHFVDAGGRLGPVRYLDYIVPGQVAVTAFNQGSFESMWPVRVEPHIPCAGRRAAAHRRHPRR